MSTIVTRAGKGSPLTHSEMDANITNLNTDKLQTPHTGSIEINNTTTGDSVTITTTEDSSTAAPVFTMKRNSASPADGDYLGQLKFQGENDADQEVVYAKITAKISDATDGTEDGLLEFALRKAGSNNIGARLTSSELKLLNDTGLDLSTSKITDVGDPTSAQDAATKAYADTKLANIVEDLSPQLGASLDVNGQSIVSISNGNIAITPDGTGKVILDGISYPTADGTANQVLKTDGSGVLSFTDASGFDGNLAGNTLTDSTQGVTIDASATNRIKFENSDGAGVDGSILFNTYAFGTAIMSAMEYRTPGAYRLNKLEARNSADDGTHDAYFYLYGEDNRIISQNPTTQAYVPLELRSSQVEVFNGNTFKYTLPTADGSANQVIKTDGSGTLSFTTPTAFDGDLDGADLTDTGGDLTIRPGGATDAKLKVLNNGSDSVDLQLLGDSGDAVGSSITVKDETDAFANLQFSAKQQDFRAYDVGGAQTGLTRFFSDTATYFYNNVASPVLRMFFGSSNIVLYNSDGNTQLTLQKVDSNYGKASFTTRALPEMPQYDSGSPPPTAGTNNKNCFIMYADGATAVRPAYSDGTNWRYMSDNSIL